VRREEIPLSFRNLKLHLFLLQVWQVVWSKDLSGHDDFLLGKETIIIDEQDRWLRVRVWRCAIIIGLWLLVSQPSMTICVVQSTSSNGPVFSDYGDFYADFTNESGCVWFHVTVTDSDGVAQVIGSTRNSSEELWHNLTLAISETYIDRYYGYYSVVLPHSGSVIYEVKYYAADTLGNWNVSEVTLHYLNNLGITASQPPLLWTIAGVLGIVAVVSLGIAYKSRRV
jgi:hypothetical protein